jgi:hypothetical protein
MIKAIKLFLLKIKIRYRKAYPKGMETYNKNTKLWKDCSLCLAFTIAFCDRYKIKTGVMYVCDHFVPKTKPALSEKEKAEFEKAGNRLLGILEGFKGMIDNFGGRK